MATSMVPCPYCAEKKDESLMLSTGACVECGIDAELEQTMVSAAQRAASLAVPIDDFLDLCVEVAIKYVELDRETEFYPGVSDEKPTYRMKTEVARCWRTAGFPKHISKRARKGGRK